MNPQPPVIKSETMLLYAKKGLSLGRVYFLQKRTGHKIRSLMERICKKCASDPMSHSFKRLTERSGVLIYYSHPAAAKLYDDTEGILQHIDHRLALHGNRKWSCIFDGDGFDIKHAMQLQMGMGLVQLLSEKYGETLQEIKVINPTWHISGMLKILSSMINSKLFAKIKMIDDRKYSVLEFL